MLITNLGTVWKLLRPSWCTHPHASSIEDVTERWGMDVQLAVAGDAGVRAPLGNSVERGVMAWSAANNPEAYQRVEDWSGGGNGVSRE